MATVNCYLTEESFLCSICLHVFTKPVTTPCGHNYCHACINSYWDNADSHRCPVCNQAFVTRPNLQVNTTLSDLALQFMKSAEIPEITFSGKEGVPCDICHSKKDLAVKSCPMCVASFCKQHLEPHLRLTGLRSHTLMDPQTNLDHVMCQTHNKITELYCRNDDTLICVMCVRGEHRCHSFVSLEEQYDVLIAKKDDAIRRVRTRIQLIDYEISQCRYTANFSQRKAEEEKQAIVELFSEAFSKSISAFQKFQAELVEVIEKKHQATKERAEGCVSEMLKEKACLESNKKQLETLSKSKDRHSFLLNFSSLVSFLQRPWPSVWVNTSDLTFLKLKKAVELQNEFVEKVINEIREIIRVEKAAQKMLDNF